MSKEFKFGLSSGVAEMVVVLTSFGIALWMMFLLFHFVPLTVPVQNGDFPFAWWSVPWLVTVLVSTFFAACAVVEKFEQLLRIK